MTWPDESRRFPTSAHEFGTSMLHCGKQKMRPNLGHFSGVTVDQLEDFR
jgi:hypothetical protein